MRTLAVATVAALLLARTALANGLGFFAAYWSPRDAEDGYGAGARLHLGLLETLDLDFRASFFPDFGNPHDRIEFDLTAGEAGVLIFLPLNPQATPYIGGGVGYYAFDAEDREGRAKIDLEDDTGFYAVAGLELGVGNFRFFAEGIHRWLEASEAIHELGLVRREQGNLNGYGANAGLVIRW